MITPDFIGVYDDIVYESFCQDMIDEFEKLHDSVSMFSKGEEANGGVINRKDFSMYFERDSYEMAKQVNVFLDTALLRYSEEHPSFAMQRMYSNCVKVQKTSPKGGFHAWHTEQAKGRDASRVLVWILYLNDTPEGEGTTEFLEYGAKLQPKTGRLVVWPAAWTHTHRGNPVYTCNKYIATGWYYLED